MAGLPGGPRQLSLRSQRMDPFRGPTVRPMRARGGPRGGAGQPERRAAGVSGGGGAEERPNQPDQPGRQPVHL